MCCSCASQLLRRSSTTIEGGVPKCLSRPRKVLPLCFSRLLRRNPTTIEKPTRNSQHSSSPRVLFLCFSAASTELHYNQHWTSQIPLRLRCRVFASRLPRRSSGAVALLLGCFEGAPPQSKGCASLNSHSTKVLVLCFSVASKEPRHNRKVEFPKSHHRPRWCLVASRLPRRSSTSIEG